MPGGFLKQRISLQQTGVSVQIGYTITEEVQVSRNLEQNVPN